MLGIGWTEFILIALVVLLVFGPERLPEVLTRISQLVFRLKDASRELRQQLDEELHSLDETRDHIRTEVIEEAERTYRDAHTVDRRLRKGATSLARAIESDMATQDAGDDDASKDEEPS